MGNIVTLMVARDDKGKPLYPHAIDIPKYKRSLQDMPNGAALIMNNEKDKEFLEDTKSHYKKLFAQKILFIIGEDDG